MQSQKCHLGACVLLCVCVDDQRIALSHNNNNNKKTKRKKHIESIFHSICFFIFFFVVVHTDTNLLDPHTVSFARFFSPFSLFFSALRSSFWCIPSKIALKIHFAEGGEKKTEFITLERFHKPGEWIYHSKWAIRPYPGKIRPMIFFLLLSFRLLHYSHCASSPSSSPPPSLFLAVAPYSFVNSFGLFSSTVWDFFCSLGSSALSIFKCSSLINCN